MVKLQEKKIQVSIWSPKAAASCLSVGSVGSELQGHGVEDAHLTGHLLHAADGALLVRVCELHHQAGRGSLHPSRHPHIHTHTSNAC